MAPRSGLFGALFRGRDRDTTTLPEQPHVAPSTAPLAGPSPDAAAPSPRAPEPQLRLEAAADLRLARGHPPSPLGRQAGPPSWLPEAETPEERLRRKLRHRVDEAIAEAEARGEFTNLRLKGKPIPAELLASPDETWLANKTLANAGFVPPWLQLRQEIDADLAECRRLVERAERFPPLVNRERPLVDLRQRLDAVRAKARRYNLVAPSMALQRPLPRTDDLLERMARAVGLPLEGGQE